MALSLPRDFRISGSAPRSVQFSTRQRPTSYFRTIPRMPKGAHHSLPMIWPAKSPDLNPIENLWAIIDNSVKRRVHNNLEELEDDLLRTWNRIPPETLLNLAHSMHSRVRKFIAAHGGYF